MNKGILTTFYSCEVSSLNLVIEVRMSDYFILFYAVDFLIVVKYIKFAVLAIFIVWFGGIKYIHIVCSHHLHPSLELFHFPKVKCYTH